MAPPDLHSRRLFGSRALFVAFVLALVAIVLANAVWVADSFGGPKDLDSFLHSGAAHSRGLNPYQYYPWLKPEPISADALNLNPPILVYLFGPLSGMDRGLVGIGLLFGSIAVVGASIALLRREYPEKRSWVFVLIVAAMAGVWHMLWYLQIYAPLMLAVTGAWLLLRRDHWLAAAILIGVVIAVKPNYAIVPVVLLAAGHLRPALVAGATAALISLVPVAIDGPQIYVQWVHMSLDFDGYEWTSNASLVSFGERLDLAPSGQLAAVALAATVVLFATKKRPSALDATALGLMTVILVGPVSWAGYTLLLVPYLFSIRWDGWTWVAVVILVLPFAPGGALAAFGIHLPAALDAAAATSSLQLPGIVTAVATAIVVPTVGAIYAWGVLLLLVRLMQRLSPVSATRHYGFALPAWPSSAVHLLPESVTAEPLHAQPAPVPVRYDG